MEVLARCTVGPNDGDHALFWAEAKQREPRVGFDVRAVRQIEKADGEDQGTSGFAGAVSSQFEPTAADEDS